MTLAIIMLLATGCASREPQFANFTIAAAPAGSKSEILDSAEAALVGLGYTIAKRDNGGGVIVTQPISLDRSGQRTWREDNPLRKIAEVRVAGSGEDTRVHCKVVIQEQAAETYRLLAYERGGDDVPGHNTAIERDAATTAEQNAIWRLYRRDKTAEREILDRITKKPARS